MASADDFSDNPDWTALIAERKIQDAIDAGLLDNLPGRGQPIDLSVNPFEPPGMGAVNRMLKANRVLPPWLLLEREIEASRALALGVLARWEASEPALRGTPDYPKARDAARAAYLAHILHNNDLVLKYNYSAPFAHRAPVPLMRQTRLREFDAQYGTEAHESSPGTDITGPHPGFATPAPRSALPSARGLPSERTRGQQLKRSASWPFVRSRRADSHKPFPRSDGGEVAEGRREAAWGRAHERPRRRTRHRPALYHLRLPRVGTLAHGQTRAR